MLINKSSSNTSELSGITAKEIAKITPPQTIPNLIQPSYSSIAKTGKTQTQASKTKVLIVYPKEGKSEQTSEETKLELQ